METSTLFYNGKIYTPNGIQTWMIIEEDKIRDIGQQPPKFEGKKINLEGNLVLPGLHDAHIHCYSLGRSMSRLKLQGTESIAELQQKLEKFAQSDDKSWVIGHGWDQDMIKEGRYPKREDLDKIISDRPVLLYRACNHIGVINSKALDIIGINANTEDPEGGKIDRDQSGRPTGILREEGLSLVKDYIKSIDDDNRLEYYRRGIQTCLQKGLTAIHTNDRQAWKFYKQLEDQDELPIRIYLTLAYSDFEDDDDIPEFDEQYGNLTSRRVKLFADGSLGAETAALRENYTGLDHNGILIDQPSTLAQKIADIHKAGYQLEVHAIGDYATQVVIEGFVKAGITQEDRGIITHCQILAEDLVNKMAEKGFIANIQPPFVPTDARWAEKRIGKSRLEFSYAWKTLLDNGVITTGGSDAPIEDADPFYGMYCTIKRPDHTGETWRGNQCLDFSEALNIYTQTSAFAVGEEDRLGKLEPGYQADFVITDPAILTETEKLRNDPLIEVWVNGTRQYHNSRYIE